MMTNCPNCGAPIDRSRDSCEYCGTPYPEKPETAKLYADNQSAMEVQIEANKSSNWQPTPEEERKMIEDMRTVEYIKYNTKLERLMDTVWFWFVVLIATIGCSLLPFIIF